MKKTKQTLLTAAAFAAAMQMASGANVSAASTNGAVGLPAKYEPAAEDVQDVYGPAPYYGDEPVVTDITEPTTTITSAVPLYGPPVAWTETTSTVTTFDPSKTTTVTLYGPPPAYYYKKGDTNGDGVVDVFDVIALRKRILSSWGSHASTADQPYDVNDDGEIGVSDLVSMQNFLLGKTKDYNDPELMEVLYGPPSLLTTTTTPPPPTSTTTTTTDAPVQLMYGPPNWWTTAEPAPVTTSTTTKKPKKTTTTTTDAIIVTDTTSTSTTIPIVQPMYGPPAYFGLDDQLNPKE